MKLKNILVVGSGVGGLLTAFEAVNAGYKVALVSKSPDPRKVSSGEIYSSTFGGEDSRYVTIAEGHPYLGTAENYISAMYPDMQKAFATSIEDGGWLAKKPEEFSPGAKSWLEKRFKANEDTAAIGRLFASYIQQNKMCLNLWSKIIFDRLALSPSQIDLNDKGIMRIYGAHDLFGAARDFHRNHDVLLQELGKDDLARQFPAYAEACGEGRVAGALIVKGLTFRIQSLLKHMVVLLERCGVQFRFNTEMAHIDVNGKGEVTSLRDVRGTAYIADHYALHPGAYAASRLYAGTPAENALAAVAGGWIKMPMPQGMDLPLKIHDGQHLLPDGRLRQVVDLNLNPVTAPDGTKWLMIGGGYVFAGMPPFEFPEKARKLMMSEIHRVTEMYLGPAYRTSKMKGELIDSDRICMRSFAPDDAELNVIIPTVQGGIARLEGGGNTGTTTKAPFIAQRALQSFMECR